MNLDDYRKKIYSYKSESNLMYELRLLDAIKKHQQGDFLDKEQENAFEELVKWIVENEPDLNDLPEKEIGKRFHVRKYEKKQILKDLVFYEVGKIYRDMTNPARLADFAFFSEHMEHGFYLSYEARREDLQNIVNGIDGKDDNFLIHCRSMNDRREDFIAYCKKNLDGNKSDAEIIGMMNPYNCGDYIELPLGVYEMAYLLINGGYLDLYAMLLTRLYYFPLQGAMLCWLHNAEEGFVVWEELEKLNSVRVNVIEYLLRDRILKLLTKDPGMLERNTQNEYISDKDRQVGHELLDRWNKKAESLACYLVDLSVKRFGEEETSVWYSKHLSQLSVRDPKFVKSEQITLKNVERCLEPRLTLKEEQLEGKNLNTLLYYAKVASESTVLDNNYYKALVETICLHVYNDRYVQPMKLDDASFMVMRHVYRCMLKGGVEGISVMSKYRQVDLISHNDYSIGFRPAMGDSVWLPIMLLMTEEIEDKDYFHMVLNILTGLASFDKSLFNDNYFVSFYLAELIVLQVLKDEKDAYELYLITNVCNLYHVLRILSANDGDMSDENKQTLRKRVIAEWDYEKKLSQQYKVQTEFLDGYLKKVFK